MIKINLKINGSNVEVPEGTTILQAAEMMNISIPAMCYMEGPDHFPSCLICVVQDKNNGKLIPACSTLVTNDMDIVTINEEIKEARKTALELLLSDHIGDCEAPCQTNCPAHMDIPRMNRLLASGQVEEALRVIKKDIALPAVLGRICPAPCERACRRRSVDNPVSICLLKRFAADQDLALPDPYIPEIKPSNGKKIGILGSGPAGLSAAYFLLQMGYRCVIFDKNPLPGGALRYAIPDEKLPKQVLDKEIDLIRSMGAEFIMNHELEETAINDMITEFDSIIVATGENNTSFNGLEKRNNAFITERDTHRTGIEGVFAIGSAIKPGRVAIRALAHGKQAALSVDQYLNGQPVIGEKIMFNSRFGKLLDDELKEYLLEGDERTRIEPGEGHGFSFEEMRKEAARCMHCDCRKLANCKLRIYSDAYGAVQKRFFPNERKEVRKIFKNKPVVYEPEKCIKCGICVRITSEYKEDLGLTFIGKGFDVEVGVPFDNELINALEKTAVLCAEKCPTGALAVNDKDEKA